MGSRLRWSWVGVHVSAGCSPESSIWSVFNSVTPRIKPLIQTGMRFQGGIRRKDHEASDSWNRKTVVVGGAQFCAAGYTSAALLGHRKIDSWLSGNPSSSSPDYMGCCLWFYSSQEKRCHDRISVLIRNGLLAWEAVQADASTIYFISNRLGDRLTPRKQFNGIAQGGR